MTKRDRSGRFARHLFRVALLAHERGARARFGDDMERLYLEDMERARRRGGVAALRAVLAGAADVLRTGISERLRPDPRTTTDSTTTTHSRRKGSPMDDLRQDLRFAIRSLSRRPAFAIVAVLTLGLGIGMTTATFSVVNGVLLRSLPYERSDQLVRLWEMDRRNPQPPGDGGTSPVVFEDWQAAAQSFRWMAAWGGSQPTLTGMGEPEVVTGAQITPDFFRVFGAPMALGRSITPEENLPGGPYAVVVSYDFWHQRLGGAADAIGRTLQLNGRSATIVGVAPAGFEFPRGARIWMPVQSNRENCGRGCVYLNVVARMKDGVTVDQAASEMKLISDRLSREYAAPLANVEAGTASLQETIVGDVKLPLYVLLGAVGLVLLIACANVANLMIARGAGRADELAVRVALGAGRSRIISQLMTESLVLALAGGALGAMLSLVGVGALRALAPDGIPRLDEVGIDATAVLFALAAALVTSLLFGFVPALQLARGSVAGALRDDANRTSGGRRGMGRSLLLAGEVALSLLLLIGAGLLLRSFASLQRIDPGYAVSNIAHFSVNLPSVAYPEPERAIVFFDELESRLEAMPGVEQVTRSLGAPLSGLSLWSSFRRLDQPPPAPGEGTDAALRVVGADYFGVMGMALASGRGFESGDRAGAPPVAVINRRVAREQFGDGDPIGKQIRLGVNLGFREEPRTIVGIVGDVQTEELAGEPTPEIYIPYAQSGASLNTFLIRSRRPAGELLAQAAGVVHGMDGALPLRSPGTMRELVNDQTARQRFYMMLLGVFAALAVTLAAVGLYGVVAYLVAQRRREIGVRMVLGANAGTVLRLVLRQSLAPAMAGAVVGLLGSLAAVRVMSSLLFGVEPTDPLTFVATTALLLGVVLIACLIPAGRATRIAPAHVLRAER